MPPWPSRRWWKCSTSLRATPGARRPVPCTDALKTGWSPQSLRAPAKPEALARRCLATAEGQATSTTCPCQPRMAFEPHAVKPVAAAGTSVISPAFLMHPFPGHPVIAKQQCPPESAPHDHRADPRLHRDRRDDGGLHVGQVPLRYRGMQRTSCGRRRRRRSLRQGLFRFLRRHRHHCRQRAHRQLRRGALRHRRFRHQRYCRKCAPKVCSLPS